ncbi:MAG TPA: site-specific integrase, partial [Armatimonadota bacterium]
MNSTDTGEYTAAVIPATGEPTVMACSADMRNIVRQAQVYFANGKAENTRKAYASDWAQFTAWCAGEGWGALPAAPETVALYLTAITMQGRTLNTLTRRLAAIKHAHATAGFTSPTTSPVVHAILTGIRRTHGMMAHGSEALLTEDIKAMVRALPENVLGTRDRALILLGFAGAFRRSELTAMNMADLDLRQDGLAVTLRFSKTDQMGQGRLVGIPYGAHEETCPVKATLDWLAAAQITGGAVFRGLNRAGHLISDRLSGRAVATIIKRAADAAGLDSTRYSPHGLRSGHCTSAARAGVDERVLMQQTGHRSSAMLRRYVRSGSLFLENSAAA